MARTPQQTQPDWTDWYHDAAVTAASLPDLLVEALKIAHTVAPGLHGRRRAGPGESFWQFRHYSQSDSISRIDWRRSARDDHLFVREQEWEAAHTVWLWPDRSPSMAFASPLASVTKERRALVFILALGEILVRGGERIAIPGMTRPSLDSQAPRRIAERLATEPAGTGPDASRPPVDRLSAHSDYVLASDFLDPLETIAERVSAIAAQGVRCHLVQVLDPVEESFPFRGRLEFIGPGGGSRFIAGRAEDLRARYQDRLRRHRAGLRDLARKHDGTFTLHHTDRPPQMLLLALHGILSAPRDMALPSGSTDMSDMSMLHLVEGGEAR